MEHSDPGGTSSTNRCRFMNAYILLDEQRRSRRWTGYAVMRVWVATLLVVAAVLLRSRDARPTATRGAHRAHRTRFTGRMANAPTTAQSPATVYSTL